MNLNIRVDVYHHQCGSGDELQHIATLLAAMTEQFKTLTEGVEKMAGELDAVAAEVAETTAKFDEVAQALTALIAKVTELRTDPVALQQFANDLDAAQNSVNDELAAAQAVLNPPAPPAP